ncbi:AbrB/MazE/SpoVT family DNA-binding domain-containing protein [Phormidium sp. LEGE 05292]|uniref:AbrB/MazE/SpoVT family DNA-binding domain-containing protein n=1 Tax=[Phormidium] sp. LEGE 05292 TaxID=767427 RepID=UPI0018806E9A|nr:AbrB/MazE/SpoVT family DNA-binding domain-containing protein [Phormidium sp. LEGE 05292]MBE9228288.1 AbrB/MazE/SpoVT family DNA-binding domain-containing protein [Phormidium sp. LEGE 05292]
MGAAIRTRIVKIGNSQGIRIPKPLLEQSGIDLDKEVEIEVEGDRLIVRVAPKIRVGWDEAFAAMAEQKDDILLDDVSTTNWDRVEWEW